MRIPNCPVCPGPLQLLGSLGHTKHYRCRDCGAEIAKTRKQRKPAKREAS